MTMMNVLPVIVAALLVATGCGPVTHGDGSIAIGRTMRDLTNFSDLVVVGTVLQAGGTRNLARQVSDPTKEAKDIVVLGEDYDVRVETTVKGAPSSESLIVVSLAKWHGTPGETAGTDRDYVPFSAGTRYVLFLKRLGDGTSAYGQGIEPFRFRIEGSTARAESRWGEASKYFPDKPLDALVLDVRAATQP
jgi:hypothetical protein